MLLATYFLKEKNSKKLVVKKRRFLSNLSEKTIVSILKRTHKEKFFLLFDVVKGLQEDLEH